MSIEYQTCYPYKSCTDEQIQSNVYKSLNRCDVYTHNRAVAEHCQDDSLTAEKEQCKQENTREPGDRDANETNETSGTPVKSQTCSDLTNAKFVDLDNGTPVDKDVEQSEPDTDGPQAHRSSSQPNLTNKSCCIC